MLTSSPTLLQPKDKYIDKMSALEVTQLREKVASLEDEKRKLLQKIETLKKEHNEEITQVL
jgi:FtsZ-binding cell division protein ZapB